MVQNFEFQYFWGFSEKLIFFRGMKILWKFFRGHHKIGLYLVFISMHLGSFLEVKVQNRGYFLGLPKFQILKFLIFFGGER